ncbi:hypothetical protein VF04_04080 [Nostoc linckia z7]|uniref:Uncharacterized protein n=2 Tax=Nostoc linckia TaxID=92942 RepID=A0A9Q6EN25_NOSLI|nr:hypothetical protein [Nostoc linckia]PHK42891.1 hypothetical protein VF12_00780 [Nostoc linckia z15]PHK48048.1 hypothetical protein VF13_01755 [Nostoc linckia z16]PHJ64968.1 hypothetical protein VF02_11565 [Nostoc linckia z1]PHJ70146.1 hypothetical protein VF05_11725 [Nostoc linckia z3]PHJ75047.1 hypothetical protein VF03_11885 [Nostoc linckia z2]
MSNSNQQPEVFLIQAGENSAYKFICWLAEQDKSTYLGLFRGTTHAYEKEVLTFQTIYAIAANYQQGLPAYSTLDLDQDGSLVQNSRSFNWMVEQKYFSLHEGGLIDVTYLLLAKLMVHFGDKIPLLPVAKMPNQLNPGL